MPSPTEQCTMGIHIEQTEEQRGSEETGKARAKLGGYKAHAGNSKQPNWAGGEGWGRLGCRGGLGADGQQHTCQQEH